MLEELTNRIAVFVGTGPQWVVPSESFLYLVNRARLGVIELEYLFVHETQPRSDQFLYLVNRARLGFTEHEYLLVHDTQSRSRYRARGGRHRAPQPSSSTSKSWYLEENDYFELHNIPQDDIRAQFIQGHACLPGGKLTSIELENPRPLLLW